MDGSRHERASGVILLPVVLAGLFALSALTPLLVRLLRRDAGYVLAAAFAVAAVAFALQLSEVAAGSPLVWRAAWAPSLGVRLSLVLDGLALLFSLVVLGIGAAVMAYSARYFRPEEDTARMYALLTAFAAAMLGLVLAGDAVVLFVFWELTTITSFFLIGGKGKGAVPAFRAFLVTGVGGLALLGGLVIFAVATGSFEISTMLDNAGRLGAVGLAVPVMLLLLAGAFTKSAQVPFHFWLPGAMVAPTPVSTYLHAATMVKAGIYLLARFTPAFAGEDLWLYATVITGLVTAIVGATLALRQYDLKALLAYSTVSQLGWLTALVGVGTYEALVAAGVHIVAHALYKSTLFMVAGIIDHEAGSRDIRELSGLFRALPMTAAATGVAALSMAGIPPLLGFISKEESLAALLGAPGAPWLAPAAAALAVFAGAMTLAYGVHIFDEAFTGPTRQPLYEPRPSFLGPALLTAAAGLLLGPAHRLVDALANPMAAAATGRAGDFHIALWHGFTPALALSALTIALGTFLFVARAGVHRVLEGLPFRRGGEFAFDRIYAGVLALGRAAAAPFLAPLPAAHVAWILASVAAALWGAAVAGGGRVPGDAPASRWLDWVVVALLALVCTGVAGARRRFAAVALLGLTGFLVAFFYVTLGAPDLALTQLLVETLTVAVVVLVFRRLPQEFRRVAPGRRLLSAAAALGAGAAAFVGTYFLIGRRGLSEAGEYFLEAGPEEAGGRNVVNTILVDFRALDTFGEITVLAVAALGVYMLARYARRGEGR